MKRIILIIISVIMLFTACKESSAEQNTYEENFDGVTFGMTQDEVIMVIGREPNYIYTSELRSKDKYGIWYYSHVFFDVISDETHYFFDDNGNLDSIEVFYRYFDYFDESKIEQMPIDLEHIKEEISKYYPENTLIHIEEINNQLFLFTENRMICLTTYDSSFKVYITPISKSK